METNNLQNDKQYGFLRYRFTGDIPGWWYADIILFIAAFDISKSFDKVWHKALLSELVPFSVGSLFFRSILNYIRDLFNKFKKERRYLLMALGYIKWILWNIYKVWVVFHCFTVVIMECVRLKFIRNTRSSRKAHPSVIYGANYLYMSLKVLVT